MIPKNTNHSARLDKATALAIATAEINRTWKGGNECGPLVILDECTIEKAYGWIFFYCTEKWAKTRDVNCLLAGNGPVVIEHGGAIHRLGTAKHPDLIIRDFELHYGYEESE